MYPLGLNDSFACPASGMMPVRRLPAPAVWGWFFACVWLLAGKPLLGATANVNIVDFAFNPASVTVHVNDTVVWTWLGPTVHTTTSDTGLWDSGLMNAAAPTFSHTFGAGGSFPYLCEVHPFMTGSVTVLAQPPPNVPPTASITSPAEGATFTAPWTGSIQASVADSDGTVTQAMFLANSTLLGAVANPSATPSIAVTGLPAGTYALTVIATDNSGASTTSVPVHITVTPQAQTNGPTITITSPLPGSVFQAPWTGVITVTNSDATATVTQIEFLAGTTLLGTLTNPPAVASLNVSNIAAGSYTLTAVAIDSLGASNSSAPVNITVATQTNQPPGLTNLSVQSVSAVTFNPQTGLFDQTVSVRNTGDAVAAAVRLAVAGLPRDVVLYDAAGTTNGTPFVEYKRPLDVGATVAFVLEYYRSNRLEFVSTNFIATAELASPTLTPTGTTLQLDRSPFVVNGQLVIEFAATPGKRYVVEYSADMKTWTAATPALTAVNSRVQWVDTGPPKTDSSPSAPGQRFYRVVQLP